MANPLKIARAAKNLATLTFDLRRLNDVFALSESIADRVALTRLAETFRRHPEGASAFVDRPRLGSLDAQALAALPEGTLGRVFVDHLRVNGLDPAALPSLAAGDDASYVLAHLYETHDIWHVVAGFSTDVAGELGLQAFYLAQAQGRLPAMLLAIGLLNTAIFALDDAEPRMSEIARGWQLGRRCPGLFGVRWGDLWATPIDEIRERFGLPLGGAGLAAAA